MSLHKMRTVVPILNEEDLCAWYIVRSIYGHVASTEATFVSPAIVLDL